MLPSKTSRSLPMTLLRAREVVMAHFRPMLARHDITEQQWRVIRVLGEGSPLDATELARRASILPPSLTRIIKTLEDRGYITRGKVEDDGRRVQLGVTPAGLALIESVTPERQEIYALIERRCGAAELQKLLDRLEILIARLDYPET